MKGIVTSASAGTTLGLAGQTRAHRDAGAVRLERRGSGVRSLAVVPKWANLTVAAVGAGWLTPTPAWAYHDTTDNFGNGAPLDVILPIAGAVALGMIALAYFGRKTRGINSKSGPRKRRAKPAHRKRR